MSTEEELRPRRPAPPPERSRQSEAMPPQEGAPRSRPRPPSQPPAKKKKGRTPRAIRAPRRRQRHRIQRVDLWSVLKISLCFFTALVVTMVLATLVVWKIADSFGAVTRIESFVDNLFDTQLEINPAIILKQGLVVAIVLDALMVITSVIAAAFYNLFAELFGGVEVFTYEQDIDPRI